jgi:acetyl-CoA synthetase
VPLPRESVNPPGRSLEPPARFNFTTDVLEKLARTRPHDEALRTISSDGRRTTFTFQDVALETAKAAASLQRTGIVAKDVVMTLLGARAEWVFTLLAAWRLGALALPCSEQLRRKDIELRIDAAKPKLVVLAERDEEELVAALEGADHRPHTLNVDVDSLNSEGAPPAAETSSDEAALLIFTSGTAGDPRCAVHAHRYLWGQAVQAEHWLGARHGDLVWCTAATGWSKSARNSFVAAWSRGASCLLHDGRFDPGERLELAAEEGVTVLCQAPTEYRMIAKRTSLGGLQLPRLRRLVSAGEPLNPEVIRAFKQTMDLDIHDGYGQTETGQLTGYQVGDEVRPGSMGKPLPGFGLVVLDEEDRPSAEGELCVDASTVPTLFRGYLGEAPFQADRWRTGDRVRRDSDGSLWFEGRLDDVIVSAGYRIGPFEVESALVSHPAVAEAAAVPLPDEVRGAVVRAVVVLRQGCRGSEQLARELQDHVKRTTAPYKYPRVVEFREELPKTPSGKIKRAELRRQCVSEHPPADAGTTG